MPKSKKNAKKAAQAKLDFKKPKLKLGKKIAPANQTKVEYKSRGINMAAQSSLLDEKKGVAVTRRRVTLEELFGQLKHYNAQIRRDALLGIKELCTTHLEAVCLRLREVFEASLKAVADQDKAVRQATSTLYRKLLRSAPFGAVLPFLKLVLMYTAQALTHLQLDVRLDALGFLAEVLECTHTPQTHPMFESLIPTLLDMLALSLRAGNTQGSAAVMCSPEARAAVLQALIKLWGPSQPTPQHHAATTRSVAWEQVPQPPESRVAVEWVLWRPPGAVCATPGAVLSGETVGAVGPLMMQAFAECAAARPHREAHVQCMLGVLQLTTALAGNASPEVSAALVPELELHVLPQLPFESIRSGTDRCALCVALCSAVAALSSAVAMPATEDSAAAQVVAMLSQMLHQGPGVLSLEQLEPPQLDSVLASLTSLTASPELPATARQSCFQGLLGLSSRLHAQSQARCAVLRLLCHWATTRELPSSQLRKLIGVLPKALWQLKGAHTHTSGIIVDTLLHFAVAGSEQMAALAPSLVPLIHAQVKGAGAGPPRSVFGPLIQLDQRTQSRFLSILNYLPEISREMLQALAALLGHPKLPPGVQELLIELLHNTRTKLAPEVFLSFMVSVLLAKEPAMPCRTRIVQCLARLRMGPQLGENVAPLIAQVLQSHPSDLQRQSAVMLLAGCKAGCTEAQEPLSAAAMPLVAKLLCDTSQTAQEPVLQLVVQWPAAWVGLLERFQAEPGTELVVQLLHQMLQSLEKMPGGLQLLRQHAAQLLELSNQLAAQVGQVASAAAQAARLQALVRYVTTSN